MERCLCVRKPNVFGTDLIFIKTYKNSLHRNIACTNNILAYTICNIQRNVDNLQCQVSRFNIHYFSPIEIGNCLRSVIR